MIELNGELIRQQSLTCISLPTCCLSALGCTCHPVSKVSRAFIIPPRLDKIRVPSWSITQSLLTLTTFSVLDSPLYLAQPPLNAMLWTIACILLLSFYTISFFCTWHVMAADQSTFLTYLAWFLESGTLILMLSSLPRHRTQMPP